MEGQITQDNLKKVRTVTNHWSIGPASRRRSDGRLYSWRCACLILSTPQVDEEFHDSKQRIWIRRTVQGAGSRISGSEDCRADSEGSIGVAGRQIRSPAGHRVCGCFLADWF